LGRVKKKIVKDCNCCFFPTAPILPCKIGACQELFCKEILTILFKNLRAYLAFSCDNFNMKFTNKQHRKFQAWAKAHGLTFATVSEYNGAIAAYYED
jgi:hypothetical protein